MATLNQLQEWESRLLEARFSGARRVRDQTGEECEYRSDRELASALAACRAMIAEATAKPKPAVTVIRSNPGF